MLLLLGLVSASAQRHPAAGGAGSLRPGSSVNWVDGVLWPLKPPGAPKNVTVTAGTDFAVVGWDHASPSEGGHAIQFTLKWQEIDEWEARWFPDWLAAEETVARIAPLTSGVTYAARVAAVNQHGRTWSDFFTFTTLARN